MTFSLVDRALLAPLAICFEDEKWICGRGTRLGITVCKIHQTGWMMMRRMPARRLKPSLMLVWRMEDDFSNRLCVRVLSKWHEATGVAFKNPPAILTHLKVNLYLSRTKYSICVCKIYLSSFWGYISNKAGGSWKVKECLRILDWRIRFCAYTEVFWMNEPLMMERWRYESMCLREF